MKKKLENVTKEKTALSGKMVTTAGTSDLTEEKLKQVLII